jgi:hypothetical protein
MPRRDASPTLALARDLSHDLEDGLAREDGVIAGRTEEPLVSEDPLLVHEEERALGIDLRRGEDPVLSDGLELGEVAEERVRELE